MLSTYSIINTAIVFPSLFSWLVFFLIKPQIAIPTFLSFCKKFVFALLTVSIPFIIWDVIATERGHWSFNPEHISGFTIASLPWEEITFFITVPFAMLTLYLALKNFVTDKKIPQLKWVWWVILIVCATLAIAGVAVAAEYTWFVFATTLVWLVFQLKYHRDFLFSSRLATFLLLGFLLFIIFNTILTGLPVVRYGEAAILNFRIWSIPIEDFGYNLLLLHAYVVAYNLYETKQHKTITPNPTNKKTN